MRYMKVLDGLAEKAKKETDPEKIHGAVMNLAEAVLRSLAVVAIIA